VTFGQSRNIPCWEHSAWSYTNVFEGKIPFPLDNFEQIEEASALVVRQTLSGPRALTGISTNRSSCSLYSVSGSDHPARRYMRHILLQRERCCSSSFSFFSLSWSYLFLPLCFAHVRNYFSISRSRDFSWIPIRVSSSFFVVVVLGYSHSRWNPPRPNDDVTLVHNSPCRTTFGFLFPFVQNEKRAKGMARWKGGWRGTLGTDGVAMYTGARATVLNGIIAIKVVAFPRGRRVRAPASYRRRTNDLN